MIDTLSQSSVIDMLKHQGIRYVNLEKRLYAIMPEDFFVPRIFGSKLIKQLFGSERWNYLFKASEVEHPAVQYAGKLCKKFQNKQIGDYFLGCDSPALLIGFVKYYCDFGGWKIVNSTIINHGGNYVLVFFALSERGFEWIQLTELEKTSIQYFYSF